MAKKEKPKKPNQVSGSEVQPNDRTNFYSDLAYMPQDLKNSPMWFSQMLFYAKKNGVPFLSAERAKTFRQLRKLKIDKGVMKRLFDPPTPMGGGGQAKYIATNWETNPFYVHLMKIVTTEMEKKDTHLSVSLADEYAMLQRQKENYKIQEQKLFRRIINTVNKSVGLPLISDSQDPYKYAESVSKNSNAKEGEQKEKKDTTIDVPTNYTELIRNSINDDEDMALYNELIYKGDIEPALEKGIDQYLIKENKWGTEIGNRLLSDIIDHNHCIGRKYTDLTTGRPVVEYLYPETTWTNPIRTRTGEDLMYVFTEDDITFGDFVRKIGKDLTDEQLVNLFEYNKQFGIWGTYTDLKSIPYHIRDNTRIRIGYFAVLTQECDSFSNQYVKGNESIHMKHFDWKPTEYSEKNYGTTIDRKHYNCWWSCYYMPPTQTIIGAADYQWQSNFIYKIEKNVDQDRFGPDNRYVKSEYVIWKDEDNPSFSDVIWLYMPFINIAWIKCQNSLIRAIPNGGKIISQEMLGVFLNAADEANKDGKGNGKEAVQEAWRHLEQTGRTLGKFTDSQGQPITDPQKMVVNMGSSELAECKDQLEIIGVLYNQMTLALSISDIREGEDLKPRQSLGGAKLALEASNKGTWDIDKAYTKVLEMFGERIVQHIHNIMIEYKKYGYKERFEDFKSLVGEANGLTLEAIADIPFEKFGVNVKNEDTSAKKDYVLNLATELAKGGALDIEIIDLLIKINNWKEAFVVMKMNYKKKKREAQDQASLEHQRQLELGQQALQIAQATQASKTQGKVQEIDAQGSVDAKLTEILAQLKHQAQSRLLEQRGENKMKENVQKAILKKDEKQNEANIDQQKAFLATSA